VGVGSSLNGVALVTLHGTDLSFMQVDTRFKEAGILPNGTYADTVEVDICRDQACTQPVSGSPFRIATRYTVSGSSATALPTTLARPKSLLAHDVVDAAMSKPLNAIVMASTTPSNALYVYDLATSTEQRVALSKAPTSLTLSPDGLTAVTGHDALLSAVDLSRLTVHEVAVATTVWDMVLDAGDTVQVFPAEDQWVDLFTVNLDTGAASSAWSSLYEKTRARLHPSGDRMYLLDTQLSPENLRRYSLTAGTPAAAGQAPYWGDWALCGNFWFGEAGDRIYTACGNTFTSDADLSKDMLYAGRIALTDTAGTYYPTIVSMTESAVTGRATILDAGRCGSLGSSDCDTLLRVVETQSGATLATYWMPPVAGSDAYHGQHGLFVFHGSDEAIHLVGRLSGATDPTQAYFVSTPQAATSVSAVRGAHPVRVPAAGRAVAQ